MAKKNPLSISDMIKNFENSCINTVPFNSNSLSPSKYSKFVFEDEQIVSPHNNTGNSYEVRWTGDISTCKPAKKIKRLPFDDSKFEEDFNIEEFINIPVDKKKFVNCCHKLSYLINRYIQNEVLNPSPSIRKKAEKEVLSIYYLFVSLYATDNIFYALNVLLQIYNHDIQYIEKLLKNPKIKSESQDKTINLIHEIFPFLTWKNILEFLDVDSANSNPNSILDPSNPKYKDLFESSEYAFKMYNNIFNENSLLYKKILSFISTNDKANDKKIF